MKKSFTFLLSLFFLFGVNKSYGKVDIIPVMKVTAMGGNYYFGGDWSSFGGYADVDLVPAMRFNEKSLALFGYGGKYRGTQMFEELLGGGTLFQESQDHFIFLKYIWKVGDTWKIKPKITYKIEWVRETKDEEWKKGLYDYNRLGGGLEIEKKFQGYFSSLVITLGRNSNMIKFPNYESLKAEKEVSEIPGEKGPGPGDEPFDYNSENTYISGEFQYEDTVFGKAEYYFTHKDYPDQKILESDLTYGEKKRKDDVRYIFLGVKYVYEESDFSIFKSMRDVKIKPAVGINFEMRRKDSNQNRGDAGNLFFTDYYDYTKICATPFVNLSIDTRFKSYFAYTYGEMKYKERLVQDEDETYRTDKICLYSGSIDVWFSYRFWKNFSVRCSGNYFIQESNTKFEKGYRYNYTSSTIYSGLSWKY